MIISDVILTVFSVCIHVNHNGATRRYLRRLAPWLLTPSLGATRTLSTLFGLLGFVGDTLLFHCNTFPGCLSQDLYHYRTVTSPLCPAVRQAVKCIVHCSVIWTLLGEKVVFLLRVSFSVAIVLNLCNAVHSNDLAGVRPQFGRTQFKGKTHMPKWVTTVRFPSVITCYEARRVRIRIYPSASSRPNQE